MDKLILLFLIFLTISCQKESSKDFKNQKISEFECLYANNASATIDEVSKFLTGKWRLRGIISMIPQERVEDIIVEFTKTATTPTLMYTAAVYKNSKLLGTVAFEVVDLLDLEGKPYVYIKSDVLYIVPNEYNFITGGMRICSDELMIDNGIAADGPGYLFRKK